MSDDEDVKALFGRVPAQRPGRSLRAMLFDKQLEFLESPSKRKVGVIGRRGGKSTIAAVALAESCLDQRPGVSFYCGITRERARDVVWSQLKKLNEEHGLGLKMNETDLTAYAAPDRWIKVTGADKMKEAEKKRGDGYKIAIVDEAGLFETYLEKMYELVIKPGLMDYDAPFWLLGTPNASCLGFFHDADTKLKGWQGFHWTAESNPHVEFAKMVKDECEDRGLDIEDPAFQREYLARWVKGGASLLYKFNPDVNLYDELPDHRWQYTIGVDLGWEDPTAICVGAYSKDCPDFYAIEMWSRSHMLPDEIATALDKVVESYQHARIVIDTGGLGKSICEGIKARKTWLHIEPTKKTEKFAHIEFLNGDMKAGRVKLKKGAAVIDQWERLHVTEDGKEDPMVPNDLADAFLYCYRDARQFMYKPKARPDPTIDTWEQELLNQDRKKDMEANWRRGPGKRAWQ